jgi:hypothetical protein
MDFIGVGAQKAGTSWIYACLYDHPELCLPFKEIHFFSRERYVTKGLDWYRNRFDTCKPGQLRGEYSTSYMYTPEAAVRIKKDFPNVKIIMSLRNPVDRAYSHYINSIKAGEIEEHISFEEFCNDRADALGQGMYYEQVKRYVDLFPREQLHICFYEDIEKDPLIFIQSIYRFLGVDDTFVPTMLDRKVNIARSPRFVWFDTCMMGTAKLLRTLRFQPLVWAIKKGNIPDKLRALNTKKEKKEGLSKEKRAELEAYFHTDVEKLGSLIQKDLINYWKFHK